MSKTNTKADWSKAIRAHIIPFGGMPAEKQTQRFSVGWHNKALHFTEIMDAIRETIIKELVYFRKVARQHIPDLLQQGWLRLWQDLQADPQLLAERSRLSSADYVGNRCGSSTLQYYLKRYSSYHQFSNWSQSDSQVFEDNITDIVIGSSLKSTGRGAHALFARKVDVHLDIAQAIHEVAIWCGDNLKKLAALYFITTSVSQVDAGRIAGLTMNKAQDRKARCVALQYWTKQVLEKLQEVFASYRPIEPNRHHWKDCVNRGELDPVIALAQTYAEQPDRLLALYILTTRVSTTTVVTELGMDHCKLKYAIECVRERLRQLYARRV